jgi:hypothetical protein
MKNFQSLKYRLPDIPAQEFDEFWQGRGGSDMMVQAIPSDHVPFVPAMYSSDVLLVQTEGVQHVTLYDLGDDDLAEGVLCSYVDQPGFIEDLFGVFLNSKTVQSEQNFAPNQG